MDNREARCVFCGGQMSFDGTETVERLWPGYELDESAQVTFAHCIRCGRDYEIVDPTKEEREGTYKEYWEERES